jgi:LysR family nitrogen assimilation transcriptional regulator
MDIRALRYFQAVAECGSYSRGSELLRISQPAISRTIGKLEAELGTAVFRRHGHGVTLTDAGQILLERSQAILRQIEQARTEIRSREAGPSGHISMAVPPGAGQYLAPTLVRRFAESYPNVALKIVAGYSGTIQHWLVRGQVDLACVHELLPQRGFEVVPLVEEEVLLVGPPGAFPGERSFVSTTELAGLPLIMPSRPNASRRLLDEWTARGGLPLDIRVEVDDHAITRALVRQGIGFTLLTRGAVQAEIERAEIGGWSLQPRASWSLAMVAPEAAGRPPFLARFMQTVRDVTRDLVARGVWPGRSLDEGSVGGDAA